MPTYLYRCSQCSHEFEEMQKISASPLVTCPACTKDALYRKPQGGSGLKFSGTGFYGTDHAPKENSKPTGCCPCGKNQGNCGA